MLCSNRITLITGLPVVFDHPGPHPPIGQAKDYPSEALKIEITAFDLDPVVCSL